MKTTISVLFFIFWGQSTSVIYFCAIFAIHSRVRLYFRMPCIHIHFFQLLFYRSFSSLLLIRDFFNLISTLFYFFFSLFTFLFNCVANSGVSDVDGMAMDDGHVIFHFHVMMGRFHTSRKKRNKILYIRRIFFSLSIISSIIRDALLVPAQSEILLRSMTFNETSGIQRYI